METPRAAGDVSGVDFFWMADGDYRYEPDREIPFEVLVRLDDGGMVEWKSDEEYAIFVAEKPNHPEPDETE